MRQILILSIALFSLTTFGQKYSDVMSQQMTSEKWNEEAKTNIRLLPKYGHFAKTDAQKKSDKEFIETTLKQDSTNRKASDHMVLLGFNYLNRDIKTAMYRFNQAYLLDSTNTDIYWGFGAIYMTLGEFSKAEQQYLQGLSIDPKNTHLLTDYATYFIAQYSMLLPIEPKDKLGNLKSAIKYLEKSYKLNPLDPNTTFKLSVCFWYKNDCDKAWQYYDECMLLGGQPITEEYTTDLTAKCKRKK